MDPNAALAEIRRLLKFLDKGQGDTIEEDRAAYDIADLVRGLDDWLSAGGFLPNAWVKQ